MAFFTTLWEIFDLSVGMGMGMGELVADNQLLRSMLQNIVADSGKVKQAHRQANDGIDRILVRVHAWASPKY